MLDVDNDTLSRRVTLLIALPILLGIVLTNSGCSGVRADDQKPKVDPEIVNRAVAYVAADFAFIERADSDKGGDVTPDNPKPNPTPSPSVDCKCGGTGFVIINDGRNQRRVRCDCPDACKCHKGQGSLPALSPTTATGEIVRPLIRGRLNRGVMIGSKTCGPCREFKKIEIPRLKAVGWKVDDDATANLQLLDEDHDTREIATMGVAIKSLPTFVRIEAGKVTATHEGTADADQIARFVYPSLNVAGGNADAATRSGQVCPQCGQVHGMQQQQQQQQHNVNGGQFLFWRW